MGSDVRIGLTATGATQIHDSVRGQGWFLICERGNKRGRNNSDGVMARAPSLEHQLMFNRQP